MPQKDVWEQEYKNPQLVSGGTEPQNDFKRFIKWLKKNQKRALEGLRVLDLGSGLGKNSIFLAQRGAEVTGMEISENAIVTAKNRASECGVVVNFLPADIGAKYPCTANTFDLVLDVMSSNSLTEEGRGVYVAEVARVLKPGGYFFVRALAKDGDKNAEALIKKFPGKELDTYVLPGLGLMERVFTEQDFVALYKNFFTNLFLQKTFGYARIGEKVYKRKYWLGYFQKK